MSSDNVTVPVVVSKEAIKEVFERYDACCSEVERLEAALADAHKDCSLAVKSIHETTGSQGPFNYKGMQLKLVVRTNKTTGAQTFFMRGRNKNEGIDIE
jgi:hypothetical protein